jgi:predicted RNA-binding protein YlxR (DUF448 family)
VLGEDGEVVPDLAASAFGRGAWVHAAPDCIRLAVPRGLAGSFRSAVRTEPAAFRAALRAAAERRVAGLLTAARRAGKLVAGSTAVQQALAAGSVERILVATDARAAVEAPLVAQAIAQGRASAWGDKALLGELTERPDTAVVGVLDRGLADALERAVAIMNLPAPPAARGRTGVVTSEDG